MTNEIRMKLLEVPTGRIDVVLDTDTYNEVDDQFAVAYMLKNRDRLNIKAMYAAPFLNDKSTSPADGMEKSYVELKKIIDLTGEHVDVVLKGSDKFLEDEKTPVISDAAKDLAERAKSYSPENPLYIVAIGAITNIASAILLNPEVCENCVLVWLGGHAHHFCDNYEFNSYQDVAAARVVAKSGIPFVQLPCFGVVSAFTISKSELEEWLVGKNPLADYLAKNVIAEAESYAKGKAWTRIIWDVTAVAWLLNDNDRFMWSRIVTTPLPTYDGLYSIDYSGYPMRYVYYIRRDELVTDLFEKLLK